MRVDYILRADLNLLPALAALLDERQVSRAAARVGMSQPAMSRTLQRLRDVLGDDLLVRGRGGYQLTPRAERIQRQVAELLPQLDNLFSDQAFAPATATDVFRLSGTDYATTILGPALFQQVFRQAPHATLSFETWQDGVFDDMERGALDLVLYGLAPRAGMRSEELFEERFVCVMSPEHPLSVDRARRRVRADGSEVHLTPIEFDLLLSLARRPGQVVSRQSLLAEVWDWADASGTRTVDSHVKALRKKIGAERIRTVHGVGYSLETGLEANAP